jgi:hypothetical protein
MKKTTHTPGPWVAEDGKSPSGRPAIQKEIVVTLLAACQAVLALPANEPGRVAILVPQIKAAILKAQGGAK